MMIYYIFALSFLHLIFALSDEMQELANQLHDTCTSETGATDDQIANVRKGVFADDEKLKCYMKCILDQTGVIDDNGILDVEAAISFIPEEYQDKAGPVIRGCGTKVGANHCDNAFLTNKCWYDAAPNDYFLV